MNGYILESRTILNSGIWKKPPLYFKVWHYLLLKAQHKQYAGLDRGQLFTSIDEIRESCSYFVGYRKMTPTKKEIWGILNWLRNPDEGNGERNNEGGMIATTKVTHGMVVSIVNYGIYQDPETYESNDDGFAKATAKELRSGEQGNNNNKNDNKNDNKNNIVSNETICRTSRDDKQRAVDAWNEMAKQTGLPIVTKLAANTKRANMLGARIQEYGIDDVIKAISNVGDSPFLQGKVNGWACSFEWVMKPNNFPKVLEGNYNKSRDHAATTATSAIDEW